MERKPRILSVGQCGYDHGCISRWLRQEFKAEVTAADTQHQAIDRLKAEPIDLVLINRIGDRDGVLGTEVIRAIKAEPTLAQTKVMLVSNHESAQNQAIELGALPGFGKNELGTDTANDLVKAALSVEQVV